MHSCSWILASDSQVRNTWKTFCATDSITRQNSFFIKEKCQGGTNAFLKTTHISLFWQFFEVVNLKKMNPEFTKQFIAEIYRKSGYIRKENCRENTISSPGTTPLKAHFFLEFCSKYSDDVFAIYSVHPLHAPFSLWQTLACGPSCFQCGWSWCWKHSQTA